ncbi:hypothetical protein XENORESO_016484, partial [Xenotaenia resolanae]
EAVKWVFSKTPPSSPLSLVGLAEDGSHQWTSRSTSCLYADSSWSWIRPMTAVSSANFRSFTDGSAEGQSFLYREEWGEDTLGEDGFQSHRLLPISQEAEQVEAGTLSRLIFWWRMSGLTVLKDELKSTKQIYQALNRSLVIILFWYNPVVCLTNCAAFTIL